MNPSTAIATLDPAPSGADSLSAVSRELLAASLAPNTRAAYAAALYALDRWLAQRGLPLADPALAEYFGQMFHSGLAPATASIAVSAIRCRVRLGGWPTPVGPLTERIIAGFRRVGARRGRGQVSGLRWEQADAAAALAEAGGDLPGLRDAALISVASDALLRVSEVTALTVNDLDTEPDGSGRLQLAFSKTDQEGRGAVLFLGPSTMRRLRIWLEAARIHSGVIFRRIRRGGRVGNEALSSQALRQIFRTRARAAGVEGRISGHSLRVGSAQSLSAAGARLLDLQLAGRWTSADTVAHYCRGQRAGQGAVARLRHGF